MTRINQLVISKIDEILSKYSFDISYEIIDNFLPADFEDNEAKEIKDIVLYSLSINSNSKIPKAEIELYQYLDSNKLFDIYVYPIFFEDVKRIYPEKLMKTSRFYVDHFFNNDVQGLHTDKLQLLKPLISYKDKVSKGTLTVNIGKTKIDISNYDNYNNIPTSSITPLEKVNFQQQYSVENTDNNYGLAA